MRLAILGAGGHGRFAGEIAQQSGWKSVTFFDDCVDKAIRDYDIAIEGNSKTFFDRCKQFDGLFLGIGDNLLRQSLYLQVRHRGHSLANIIHPNSIISNSALLSSGIVVMPNAVINAHAEIACGTIINTGAVVEHDAIVRDFSHICPGAIVLGGSEIGRRCFIGAGSVIRNGIKIVDDVILGANSFANKNILKSSTFAGNPASRIEGKRK